MKKYIISLIVALMLLSPVYGQGSTDITQRPTSYWFSGNPDSDRAWNWMKLMDGIVMGARGTGKVWYVDSGVSSQGNGSTVTGAKSTLAAMLTAAAADGAADRGDIIYMVQGHEEGSALPSAIWNIGIAGLRVEGLGVGDLKPTFTYSGTGTVARISADNVTLANVRFVPSVDSIGYALQVGSSTDYTQILGVEFGWPASSTVDEFDQSLIVGTGTGVEIRGCTFDAGVNNAVNAIAFNGADNVVISDNFIRGDYSTACIISTSPSDNVLIEDNILWNGVPAGLNTEPVWELISTTTGITNNNKAACDVVNAIYAFYGNGVLNFGNSYNESVAGTMTALNMDQIASMASQTSASLTNGAFKTP